MRYRLVVMDRFRHHSLALLTLLITTAALVAVSLLGLMHSFDAPLRETLTGAASTSQQVGYVAVTDEVTLVASLEAIRHYPVVLKTGIFRGHHFIRIEGDPNTVRSATEAAAYQASIHDGLVYSGIQIE